MEVVVTIPEHDKTVVISDLNFQLGTQTVVLIGDGNVAQDITAILAALSPEELLVITEFFKDIMAEALTIDKGDLTGDVF